MQNEAAHVVPQFHRLSGTGGVCPRNGTTVVSKRASCGRKPPERLG